MSLKRVLTVLAIALACGAAQAGTLEVMPSGVTANLQGISVYSSNFAVAAGASTTILKYNGTSWAPFSPAPTWIGTANFWGVTAISDNLVWISDQQNASGGSASEATRWDGTSWANQDAISPNDKRVYGNWANSSSLFIGGTNTGISVYNNGTWTHPTLSVTGHVFWDVDASGVDNIWAVSHLGSIQVSTDSGATWTAKSPAPPTGSYTGVSVVSTNSAWICATSTSPTKVYHWNGTSFETFSIPGIANVNSIFAFADNDVWICGTALVAHYNGTMWSILDTLSLGVTEILNHIDGAGTDDTNKVVFIVGNSGKIIKATYDSNPWPLGTCVPNSSADFNRDCKVDFKDFVTFATDWLGCANANDPACY